MKYDNTFYMQLSRSIFDEEHKNLSVGAKWLFVVLNELEQRYCTRKTKWFFRSDEELANDAGYSIGTLKKYKAELKKNANDLVVLGKCHWIDPETGKKSEKAVTSYTIKK